MSDSDLGWRGKKVRNEDGRTGVIYKEFVGFGFAGLDIRVDDGVEGYVQLNTLGKDSGDTGWSWWCEEFSGGARWIPLGDHWRPVVTESAAQSEGVVQ